VDWLRDAVTEAGVAATRVSNKRLLMSDEGIRGAISVLMSGSLPALQGYFGSDASSRRHQFGNFLAAAHLCTSLILTSLKKFMNETLIGVLLFTEERSIKGIR
jgi:NhaP-type Na+/H+ or K+/H+ antiporter